MNSTILSTIGILLAAATGTVMFSSGGDALESGLSKATAATALISVAQIAQAVQLRDLQEGDRYEGPDLIGLVDGQYLRKVPDNPLGAGTPEIVKDGHDRLVAMPMGPNSEDGCDGVLRMMKQIRSEPSKEAGCKMIEGRPAIFAKI